MVRQVLPGGATQVYSSQPAAGVDVEAGQTSFAINFGDRVSQQAPDFNLDAQPDLVRVVPRGAVTDLVIDLMSGERTAESLDLGPFDPGQWRPVAVGDFDGDNRAEVLAQSRAGGGLQVWKPAAPGWPRPDASPTSRPAGSRWRSATSTAQNTSDLVLQQDGGRRVVVWLMNGGDRVGTLDLGRLAPNEQVEAAADLDGDGLTDLLVHDRSTGDVKLWKFDGLVVAGISGIGQIGGTYHVVGVRSWEVPGRSGSFIYWQDQATGDVVRWDYEPAVHRTVVNPSISLGRPVQQGLYLSGRMDTDNAPPELPPLGPFTVVEGSPLTFTVTASDPDPGQTLTYSLDPGAPEGPASTRPRDSSAGRPRDLRATHPTPSPSG